MLVRLRQEVQEVSRRIAAAGVGRLTRPDPPLGDGAIRLEPLTQRHVQGFLGFVDDESVQRYTMVPSNPDEAFVRGWIRRYEDGWRDGSRAGFAIADVSGEVVGFAALVQLDFEGREAEIGYLVAPPWRGRGIAGRAVALLTDWGFETLGLVRLELRIDIDNGASERVAERLGYVRDGILRSKHFKEGRRVNFGVWSRLNDD
jgi:RimJ/RimL family protein N-acetyltransferase